MNPRISVIIISYNQEDVIIRSINSVISQVEYLHELIISDDCSTDGTWNIISGYVRKFPSKIRAFRQETNRGIYENLQSTFDKPTGDLIFFLAGDDTLGDQLFFKTIQILADKKIDYETDKFCVITDYRTELPDGSEIIYDNNKLVLRHDPFSLKFRYIITNRALGESKVVFAERKKKAINRSQDSDLPSFLQENYFDILPFYIADKFYYIPYVGNSYFSDIGISKKISKNKRSYYLSVIDYCEKITEYFPNISYYDIKWLKFNKSISQFALNRSFPNFFTALKYLILLNSDPLKKYYMKNKFKQLLGLCLNQKL